MEMNSKQIQISDVLRDKNNENQIEKFLKADKKINEKREVLFNKLMNVKALYFNQFNNVNSNQNPKNADIDNSSIQFLTMQVNILVKLIKATKIKMSLAAKLEKFIVNGSSS